MTLSELLDPRLYAKRAAAEQAAAEAAPVEANPWAAEDAAALASQIADLAELRALAMGLARRAAAAAEAAFEEAGSETEGAAAQAAPAAAASPRGDGATASLNRLARTVRLTARLEKQLRDERARGLVPAASAAAAKTGAGAALVPTPLEHTLLTREERASLNEKLFEMVKRKQTIVGVIQEILEADGRDEETIDDVGETLGRRLLDWEPSDTFNLPVGRMVARLCVQMRVAPDWSMFKDRDWAIEEAARNAIGSPYGNPVIKPWLFTGDVPTPDRDADNLAILARGFKDPPARGSP